jgi:hypothetical protein
MAARRSTPRPAESRPGVARLAALGDLAERAATVADVEAMLSAVVEAAVDVVGGSAGQVWASTSAEASPRLLRSTGSTAVLDGVPDGRHVLQRLRQQVGPSGQPARVISCPADPSEASPRSGDRRAPDACVGVAIRLWGDVRGVLVIVGARER